MAHCSRTNSLPVHFHRCQHNTVILVYIKLIKKQKTLETKYRVAHRKHPKLCNDAVLLYNRIQTKRNKFFKEQSELNSVRNYDVIRFCFDSEIRKRVVGV